MFLIWRVFVCLSALLKVERARLIQAMPSGQHVMQNRTYMYESNNQAYDANGDESAASILQSVKEQVRIHAG